MVGWREGGVGLVEYDGSVAFPLPAGRPAQLLPPCTHTPPMSPPTLLPPKHSTTKGECMGKETKLGAYKAQLHSRGILRTSPRSKMGTGTGLQHLPDVNLLRLSSFWARINRGDDIRCSALPMG